MASTVTITRRGSGQLRAIDFDVTADTDGSVTATNLPKFEGRIVALETDPGSPAPTTLYDIALNDDGGADRLATVGANRSATTTERVELDATVDETEQLQLAITNNSVSGAKLKGSIWYVPAGMAGGA